MNYCFITNRVSIFFNLILLYLRIFINFLSIIITLFISELIQIYEVVLFGISIFFFQGLLL